MGLTDKLLYSSKFLALILFLLYLDYAVMTADINRYSIIYGTAIAFILLLYLVYYSKLHRSVKEVFSLTAFTAVSIILGAITGLAFGGLKDFLANAYVFTLTLAILLLLALSSRIVKV